MSKKKSRPISNLLSQLQDFSLDNPEDDASSLKQMDIDSDWTTNSQGQDALAELLSKSKKPSSSNSKVIIPTRGPSIHSNKYLPGGGRSGSPPIPPIHQTHQTHQTSLTNSYSSPALTRPQSPKINASASANLTNLKSASFSSHFVYPKLKSVHSHTNEYELKLLTQEAMKESEKFDIMDMDSYMDKKKQLKKLYSIIRQSQSSAESDPTFLIDMLLNLFTFTELEAKLLQHCSATLFYKTQQHSSTMRELHDLKLNLKEKDQVIEKLQKNDTPFNVSNSSTRRRELESDTDVDESSHYKYKKSESYPFALSKSQVEELSEILKKLEPNSSYPTPKNLIYTLKNLQNNTLESKYSDASSSFESQERLKRELKRIKEENKELEKKISEQKNSNDSLHKKDSKLKDEHSKELRELRESFLTREEEIRKETQEEINLMSEQADKEIRDLKLELKNVMAQLESKSESKDKEWDNLKHSLEIQHEYELNKIQSQTKSEIESAKRQIDLDYRKQIIELEEKLERLGLESAKQLEKELERNRAELRRENDSVSIRHHQELDRMRDQFTSEKNELRQLLEKTQSQSTQVEQELGRIREAYTKENEMLNETISLMDVERKDLNQQIKTLNTKLSKETAFLDSELNTAKAKLSDALSQLDKEKESVSKVKQSLSDRESEVASLNKTVQNYKKLHEDILQMEDRFKAELNKKDQVMSHLEETISKERQKVKDAMENANEDKASALDQVDRIKRRLAGTERELKRLKDEADEKESEILDLKRLLRSQNKQLESALGGSTLNKDKEYHDALSEVEVLNSEISVLKRKLQIKEKEVFEVRMEASEAYDKATKLEESMAEINQLNEQVDRLSGLVLELKTSKVQLMERVDNAEHKENLLKNQLSIMQQEMKKKSIEHS